MGKVTESQVLSQSFPDISFDEVYVLSNGTVNGERADSFPLQGEKLTIGVCFRDTQSFSYTLTIAEDSHINLYVCGEEGSCGELQILCGERSECNQIVIQQNATQQTYTINQQKDSFYKAGFFQLNGKKNVVNLVVNKESEQANTDLYGVFMPMQDEIHEIITRVNHDAPECETNELFRGIADDNGEGTFSGLIYVAKDSQKTSAKQQNRNILLSKNARIHSEPQLEIYADDVICNHGSSTGQIDAEALWYMQARGIDKISATKLLVGGFANDVLEKISDEKIRDFVSVKINEKLTQSH